MHTAAALTAQPSRESAADCQQLSLVQQPAGEILRWQDGCCYCTYGPWPTADSESRPPAASGELRPVRPGGGIGTETVTPNPAATGTRVGVCARVAVRARAWKSQTPRLTAGRPTDFEKKVGRLSHPDLGHWDGGGGLCWSSLPAFELLELHRCSARVALRTCRQCGVSTPPS